MAARKASRGRPARASSLQSFGIAHRIVEYPASAVIFSQGDPATEVMRLEQGAVKLSVLSRSGKEAIVSIVQPEDFFGEACLAGQVLRIASAVAVDRSTVSIIDKPHMIDTMRRVPEFNDQFVARMLARNIRMEEDLIDHLFNSAEKRLARTLLLLARYGSDDGSPQRAIPRLSQEELAEIVGTTRGRVSYFMNKFRRLGLVEYNGEIRVKPALLSVVLHEPRPGAPPQPDTPTPSRAARKRREAGPR